MPKPVLVVHPPGDVSLDEAHAAIELWEHYSGKTLDSAQRLAVELMLAEVDDRWAARTTGRAEPRQNGKGDELEVVEAWGLLQRGEWIVHSAHEIPTAKSAHQRLVGFFESHRDLRNKKAKVRYANGDQAIEMKSGAVVVYRTRTAGGGRGLDDISRLVVDEAQWAQPEQLASAMPILAANPNPQTNFAGSAGIAQKSDWWWDLRVRALKDAAGQFSWLEHSAETLELSRDGRVLATSPDPEDREAWKRANPALGSRIEEAFLAEQLRTLGPDLFSREHLGVWDPYPGDEIGFIPQEQWNDLVIEYPKDRLSSFIFGLSVAPDGRWSCVGSAARMRSGALYIDKVDYRPGTDWLVERVVELYQKHRRPVRVNPAAPEGAFVRPLRDAGVDVVEVVWRDYVQACGEVLESIRNGRIHHLGQEALDRAVRTAQRRDVGKDGGWVWTEAVSQVDISPLKAATLAVIGVSNVQPPKPFVVVGRQSDESRLSGMAATTIPN